VSVEEIKSEIESLAVEDRRQLAAYLIALRHKDLAGYRASMAAKKSSISTPRTDEFLLYTVCKKFVRKNVTTK
jgi:hypothetical protein